jgi:molybdopterin converting factor small subunit
VRDMLGTLRSLPGAASLPPSPLVAVNEHYAGADQVLRAGDEVAVIPPVAGG